MPASSAFLLLNVILSTGLGFPFWFLAARALDPHALGLGSGVLSAGLLSGNIALFGAGAVIITKFPSYRHDPVPLLRTAFTLVSILALLTSLASIAVIKILFSNLGPVLWSPGDALAFIAFIVGWSWLLMLDATNLALRRADHLPIRSLVVGALKFGMLPVCMLVLGSDRPAVITLCWLIAIIAGCAVGQRQLQRVLPAYTYRPYISATIIRLIIKRGLPNHTVTMSLTGASLIVPLVVTEVVSPTANAHWYAVWMVAALVLFIPDSVAQAFLAQASHTPQALAAGTRQSLVISMTLSIPLAIGLALLAELILGFLGSAYAEAGSIPLRILMLGVVPRTCIETYVAMCRVTHNMREAIASCSLLTGCTVASVAIGGHTFGLIGIAGGWLTIQVLLGSWSAIRLVQRSRLNSVNNLLPSATGS